MITALHGIIIRCCKHGNWAAYLLIPFLLHGCFQGEREDAVSTHPNETGLGDPASNGVKGIKWIYYDGWQMALAFVSDLYRDDCIAKMGIKPLSEWRSLLQTNTRAQEPSQTLSYTVRDGIVEHITIYIDAMSEFSKGNPRAVVIYFDDHNNQYIYSYTRGLLIITHNRIWSKGIVINP